MMIADMLVLGSALALLAAALGAGPSELSRETPAVLLLGMGFSMTAPMVWWMSRRGHSRAATREMAVAMFPSMLAVMLLRRQEYSHRTQRLRTHRRKAMLGSTAEGNEPPTVAPERFPALLRKVATLLARRWPTWLALGLVTVIVADRGPLPVDTLAWVALVLPLAYLAFGAARKQLQPPAILVLQLTALLFYIGLTTVALSVGDDIARYLVGFGWIAHAIWDGAHYRANRVVPRPWAEWCGVVDVFLGSAILFLG
jgi:Mg2+/citrate symporter